MAAWGGGAEGEGRADGLFALWAGESPGVRVRAVFLLEWRGMGPVLRSRAFLLGLGAVILLLWGAGGVCKGAFGVCAP